MDLRDGAALDRLGGAFDHAAYSVDVRRPDSRHTPGRHNIPSVGVFVWRLKSYSVTHAPASLATEADGPHCFTFSVLGNDTQLFNRIETEAGQARRERGVPQPIRRRMLEARVSAHPPVTQASADFYGAGNSLAVYAPNWPAPDAAQPIPQDLVIPADLSDWRYRVPKGKIAVDPVRGRIIFPTGQLPRRGAWVDYQYGFSADMGGGEYERTVSQPVTYSLYRVAVASKDKDVFHHHQRRAEALGERSSRTSAPSWPPTAPEHAGLADGARKLPRRGDRNPGQRRLYLNGWSSRWRPATVCRFAPAGCRPDLRLLDYMTERPTRWKSAARAAAASSSTA